MARAEGLHSRVIAWLKILLPLVALALLSTIFLLSTSREQALDVPFAAALENGETVREEVSAPYYAGTTRKGETVTMTARTATPLGDGLIRADELTARLQMKDGGEINLNAAEATLRDGEQSALLDGGVTIVSSTGYTLTTSTLTTAIDRVEAESAGPVQGEGPLGTLEAGKFRIVPEGEDGNVQLLFTGGVKLIYLPQTQ